MYNWWNSFWKEIPAASPGLDNSLSWLSIWHPGDTRHWEYVCSPWASTRCTWVLAPSDLLWIQPGPGTGRIQGTGSSEMCPVLCKLLKHCCNKGFQHEVSICEDSYTQHQFLKSCLGCCYNVGGIFVLLKEMRIILQWSQLLLTLSYKL